NGLLGGTSSGTSFPRSTRQEGEATRTTGAAKRLKDPEVQELISAYRSSTIVYELGKQLGINLKAVSVTPGCNSVQILDPYDRGANRRRLVARQNQVVFQHC